MSLCCRSYLICAGDVDVVNQLFLRGFRTKNAESNTSIRSPKGTSSRGEATNRTGHDDLRLRVSIQLDAEHFTLAWVIFEDAGVVKSLWAIFSVVKNLYHNFDHFRRQRAKNHPFLIGWTPCVAACRLFLLTPSETKL